MSDELRKSLLGKLFVSSVAGSKGLNAVKFRAKHHEHLEFLDTLESSGYIERRDDNYYLRLIALAEIEDEVTEVESLLYRCEHLFQVLRRYYLEHPGQNISLNKLTGLTDLSRRDINIGLSYMVGAPIFGGYTTRFYAVENATIMPGENILKYKSFKEVIYQMREWSSGKQSYPLAQDLVTEAQELNADTLQILLHPEISKHALQQFIDGHLRDAVLNSVIAVFDLIRSRTQLNEDGDKLIGKAFSLEDPYLIFSELSTESGQNDQKGFIQIYKGVFQGIRNPKAHSLNHDLSPMDAAQCLVLASLLARRVEEATLAKANGT